MKKVLSLVLLISLIAALPVEAAKDPNRVTMWNRVTDFFATVGKSEGEKIEILKNRKDNRRRSRVFKQKQDNLKETQKKMRKQNEAIMENIHTKKVPHSRGGVDAN